MSKDRGSRAFHAARQKKQQQKQVHNVSGAFAQAIALAQRGLVADARLLCRQVLQKAPRHFDALHFLAMSVYRSGRREEAERLLGQAVEVEPRSAAAHCNRGVVQQELGRFQEALASSERAIALKPDLAEAHSNRANTLTKLGRWDEAVAGYDRAVAINPRYADAFSNRGHALLHLRRFDEAIASYDRAIALKPDYADAWSCRGNALANMLRFEEAIASYDKAIAINEKLPGAWIGLGNIFLQGSRFAESFAAYEKALAVDPRSIAAMSQLAQWFEAQGKVEEALQCYDEALAIEPHFADAISNRIFVLDFVPTAGFEEHQEARRLWWQRIGLKIAADNHFEHGNECDPARRLVVGYVSSDFRRHSAAFDFKPVFDNHDKTRFEIVCYSCSPTVDQVTLEFQRAADVWRDASQLSDQELAAQIMADRVDILVDLSGHTKGNRLGVFAMKPAPIQVTAWGHGTGNGCPTIDYLFSDPVAIPPEVRHLFAETVYDLPCFITMEPPSAELRATAPPLLSKGHVTFGVFNRVSKISDDAIAMWSRILIAVPRSRIMVKHYALDDALMRIALRQKFEARGVAAERVELRGSTSREDHLRAYGEIDISLDPFPMNGGVSTWECLHMGVPVVAKLGRSLPSRASGAILSSIGMSDWVASDANRYAQTALKYAAMPEELSRLRRELPAMIATSAAGNSAAYTRAAEDAYRTMWRDYCARAGS